MVSIMFRTHKSLSNSSKISSLYVFDALARAAREAIDKKKVSADPASATGNCATFLLKLEGILESFVQDLIRTKSPEVKVSTMFLFLGSSNRFCHRDHLPECLGQIILVGLDSQVTTIGYIRLVSGTELIDRDSNICDCNRLDFLKVANNHPLSIRLRAETCFDGIT
jgi:hypothetical protein